MELKTLSLKRIVNGIIMMTEPTLWFTANVELFGKITVDEYFAGRIDLLADHIYGDQSYADYILKYNNIFNPFAIGPGDILMLPKRYSSLKSFIKPVPPTDENLDTNLVRDKFVNTKRLSEADKNRVEYLKRKAAAYSNGASQMLPPNVLKPGASNVTLKNGDVIFNATIDLTK